MKELEKLKILEVAKDFLDVCTLFSSFNKPWAKERVELLSEEGLAFNRRPHEESQRKGQS